jgi:hypothetical protein
MLMFLVPYKLNDKNLEQIDIHRAMARLVQLSFLF